MSGETRTSKSKGARKSPARKIRPGITRAQQAEDTRERILLRSIEMFNRHGVQSVSVEQIASKLKISPGNLTYYYKRKSDLIKACFVLLEQRLRLALSRPSASISAIERGEYLIDASRILWQFRFYFNGLNYILEIDPALRKDFFNLREWVLDMLEADCRTFLAQGYILPEIPPNTFRLLVQNVWAQWLNWLRMQQLENPAVPMPENEALYDCALHQWSMYQRWLRPDFATELLKAFRSQLDLQPAKARRAAAT